MHYLAAHRRRAVLRPKPAQWNRSDEQFERKRQHAPARYPTARRQLERSSRNWSVAARRKLRQKTALCRQSDDTTRRRDVRSVNNNVASWHQNDSAEDDATSAIFNDRPGRPKRGSPQQAVFRKTGAPSPHGSLLGRAKLLNRAT